MILMIQKKYQEKEMIIQEIKKVFVFGERSYMYLSILIVLKKFHDKDL